MNESDSKVTKCAKAENYKYFHHSTNVCFIHMYSVAILAVWFSAVLQYTCLLTSSGTCYNCLL